VTTIEFTVSGLTKVFNRRKIFSDVSFQLGNAESLAIAGRNGSGKSTLVKILCNVLSATRGDSKLIVDGENVPLGERFRMIGFVSPYLQLYDEFTGWENLDFFRRVRGLNVADETLVELFKRVSLFDRRYDFVRGYSSGMKQRLKYLTALLHQPLVLIVDEPTSNLDAEGASVIYDIMEEQKAKGVLIVATNDVEDIQHCSRIIDLNQPQPSAKDVDDYAP
jgi:heme exporter protein A